MRKHLFCHLLAFFIPILFMTLAFILFGFEPFGHKTLSAIDAFGQYFPMLKARERLLFSGNVFSFSGLLGVDLRAQNAYYTNSPLWILLFLLPGEITSAEVNLMVVLRFGLAGLSFYSFISRFRDSSGIFSAFPRIALSTAYACSGFMLAFINQFMWTDCVILLPLIILGLKRLCERRKPLLYIISLSLCIYSCFYTAYMVCVFVCIWFVGYMARCPKKFIRNPRQTGVTCLLFFFSSLIAGVINLPVLIPLIKVLRKTAAASLGFNGTLKFYYPFYALFPRLLPFTEKELVNGPANIYAGLLTLFPAAFFFISKKCRLRDKLCYAWLLLFLLLSFDINLLDYIWHGFHYPNQLPGRQSFLFIFVILTASAEGLRRIPFRKSRHFSALFTLFCLAELFGNTLYQVGNAAFVYRDTLSPYEAFVEENRDRLTPDGESGEFFRTEINPPRDNGGLLYGLNSISYYSSTMSENAYRFFQRLGCPIYAKNVSTRFAYDPKLYDLFGIRYLISDTALNDGSWIRITEKNGTFLYENPYALPLGFPVNDAILSVREDEAGEALVDFLYQEVQNAPEALLNFTRIAPGKIEAELIVSEDTLILFTLPYEDAEVIVDGKKITPIPVLDYLLGLKFSEGVHKIRIGY